MKIKKAKEIIKKNKKDWNKIAHKFSNTRKFLWPELKKLDDYVKKGDKVIDLGCGNGRLVKAFKKPVSYTGVDLSKKLINIAQEKYKDDKDVKFIRSDVTNLPFDDGEFDVGFSIAVFHHIPSIKLREKFLKEVTRVLKPNSYFVLSVWNLWSLKNLIRYKIWPMIFGWRPKGLDWKDVFIPFQTQKGKVKRYYHCFTKRELINLFKRAGFDVEKVYKTKKGNIFIVGKNVI